MASAPQYTRNGYRTTFRALTSDVQQGAVMGRYVVEKLGAKRIVVIDDRSAYGQALADEFERAAKGAGATLGRREFVSDRATDFAALLTSIRAAKPDAVFFAGADAQGGPMAKQLRALGLKTTFAGGEMLKSPNYLALAGAAAEGTVASLAGMPIDRMPGGPAYAAKYKAKFGAEVEIYSPYAYDATQVMVAAMRAADSTQPATWLPKLAAIRHAGVTSGAIEYDEFGDLKAGAITVYAVENGAWVVREAIGQ
jgi:branched-chain amino acid transport system substrate-binding protein